MLSCVAIRDTQHLLEHSREIRVALESSLGNMRDIETGYRGYLLTDDQTFLEPYYNGTANIKRNIDKLEKARSQEEKTDDMEILKNNIDAKISIVAQAIKAKREGKEYVPYVKSGKQAMDKVREVISHMKAQEEYSIQTLVLKMDYIFRWMIVNVIIYALISSFFLLSANKDFLIKLWQDPNT